MQFIPSGILRESRWNDSESPLSLFLSGTCPCFPYKRSSVYSFFAFLLFFPFFFLSFFFCSFFFCSSSFLASASSSSFTSSEVLVCSGESTKYMKLACFFPAQTSELSSHLAISKVTQSSDGPSLSYFESSGPDQHSARFWSPKMAFPPLMASLAHLHANLGSSPLNLSRLPLILPRLALALRSSSLSMKETSGLSFLPLSA